MSNYAIINRSEDFEVEEDLADIISFEDAIDEIEYTITEDSQDDEVIEANEVKRVFDSEDIIRRRHLTLIRQDIDREKNEVKGWSNPDLSSGRTLNEEVVYYQQILDAMEDRGEDGALSHELNQSFQHIAGYYCNFEYRWYGKMSGCFERPEDFYDFYYDLLRECIVKFNSEKKAVEHERDFRKADSKCYFNQYFFGALEKRKISKIKSRFTTKSRPSIICEVCGELVAKVTNFHLQHCYDENRIKKEFKVLPVSINVDGETVRKYEMCPICGAKDVPVGHVTEHHYAEILDTDEYARRYPFAKFSASIVSLQSELPNKHGEGLTLEDVYGSSRASGDELDLILFKEHIDYVLRDNPFLSQVIQMKLMRYRNNEIAEEIGCKVSKVNSAISRMKKDNKTLSKLFPNDILRRLG